MNPEELIHRYLLGEATGAEIKALEVMLVEDVEVRRKFIFEAGVDAGLREIALERVSEPKVIEKVPFKARFLSVGFAAGVAFLLGVGIMHFGGETVPDESVNNVGVEEPMAEGFAVIENLFGAEWAPNEKARRKGDSLGAEVLRLQGGLAEVQFFSGATMMIQGPAEIALKSAWEAHCQDGVVRMRVPPAARGFKLCGPETEIVDLGTEFGFQVRDGAAHVEVLDGEISFRHREGEEHIATKGAAWALPGDRAESEAERGLVPFPKMSRMGGQVQLSQRKGFEQWQSFSADFARDERVIAYYSFDRDDLSAVIPSLAEPRSSELDGAVVLAESAAGRWPGMKQALEFRRPGARVRVRIPGEFQALTFSAWVRLDSLDRRYNALFMGDGYETGEPHWQIRDDGKLMLSVMVDDSRHYPDRPDLRYHRVYFSPPMWDLSMSGQWLHLASVFDPASQTVSHYVNGTRLSREVIAADFLIATLRIGNAEIGNWGQPLRKDPSFAIRNLNGRIDEIAILNAALTDTEIRELHDRSRAGHY